MLVPSLALAAILDQGSSDDRACAHASLVKAVRRALSAILGQGVVGHRVPAGLVWLLEQFLPSPHAYLLVLPLMFSRRCREPEPGVRCGPDCQLRPSF